MRTIRDFKCSTGHTTEELVESGVTAIDCPKCGTLAARTISPVRCKLDHSFPGEADKWARRREQGARRQTSE